MSFLTTNQNPGSIYRHFRGGYYLMHSMATIEKTGEVVVVYESLQDHQVWVRPLSEFMEDVSQNENNPTGQKHRFEPVPNFQYQLGLIPTETLMQELLNRSDCPDELKSLNPERVWRTEYLIGRFRKEFINDQTTNEDFFYDYVEDSLEKAVEKLRKLNDPRLTIVTRLHIKQDFD